MAVRLRARRKVYEFEQSITYIVALGKHTIKIQLDRAPLRSKTWGLWKSLRAKESTSGVQPGLVHTRIMQR